MGTVFDIQRCCTHDGPGIRTTVFLKGCPLSCAWCHNPESHKAYPQLLFSENKCTKCGACAAVCPKHSVTEQAHVIERSLCTACGNCTEVCTAQALEITGRNMEADEIIAAAVRDKMFYGTDGGITVSGGEPLFQKEFTAQIAKKAHEAGMNVCIETSGYGDLAYVLPYVDTLLFDIKLTESAEHIKWTGVSNDTILKNLEFADSYGIPIVLRCPIIPDVNDNMEHYLAIASIAEKLKNAKAVELEPYHPLGLSKSERLGRVAEYQNQNTLQKADLAEALKLISTHTVVPVKIS